MIVALAILVVSALILVHELGHLVVGKLLCMKVEVFSIGFGTVLLARRWGGTQYQVCLFPLGGYVKVEDYKWRPSSPIARAVMFVAGPLFSLLAPAVMITVTCWINHLDTLHVLGLFVTFVGEATGHILGFLSGLVTHTAVAAKEVSGPVRMVAEVAKSQDWEDYVYEASIISTCIGLSNLLPIPPLDGGQILLCVVEAVFGAGAANKVRPAVYVAGGLFVVALLGMGAWNDISRLI